MNLCKKLIDKHNFDVNIGAKNEATALHYSAISGSYELVKYFVGMGTDIHLKANDGKNCFHFAAQFGHLNLCKKLIDKHNFDVNIGAKNEATALHYSAISGSYELVKYFVGMGTDIHLKTNYGENCLHFAAGYGHLNLCKKLIDKHNFDVNIGTKNGFTALHCSAMNGSYELVKYFVGMGTDIHLKTNDGQNCLHFAAQFGHLNLCKKLIDKHNFDVNIGVKNEATALHYSAISGSYELVKYFVGMGTDIHLKTNYGENCLHFAARYGHLNLCKKLIDKHNFDVNIGTKHGFTALHCSATTGSYELVKYFVGMGTDIHLKTNDGKNCLHFAAQFGHLNLCKKLIDKHNFDVNIGAKNGATALHYSAISGSYELVKYFVGMGTDIHLKTNDGENCLHFAAQFGHLNLCKKLIDKHNFDVNIGAKNGATALHYSAISGSYELVKYFVGMGTDIHLKTNDGENCLHFAAQFGHLNLCKKLIDKHNFDVNIGAKNGATALHYSAISGSYELVKYFVGMGTDIHLKTNDGQNCLHFAAGYGHLNLCKKLIDKHNFDVNIGTKHGFIGLHCSATNGSYELVKYFVGMGTDIHLKTNDGENCLHFAAQFGHLNLCKKLIDKHNFDVNIGAKNGATALHYSAISGSYELVKYFVGMGTDIHLKTNDEKNCLHFAAGYGHLNLCKKLIDKHNFDVNIGAKNGATALHYSAISGSYELVRYFVGMGTDIHLKTNDGKNCLHFAAQSGHLNLCKKLIDKHNFDVNIGAKNGATALHYSVISGSYELVKYFVGMGTDIHLKTNDGENCLHFAAQFGHLNLCKKLIDKHNFDVNIGAKNGATALHYSAISGSYELVKYFVGMGTDIHLKTNDGQNCLHFAAQFGHLNLCKKLIDKHNFDVNIGAKNGATALHYSVISGSYELVKYFVGMGTDIHLKTNDGKNCLHFAAQFGHLNLCKKLIDKHNFDVNIGAKNGATALHYSAISGSYELVKYFVGMGTDIHLKTNDGQNCLHFAAQFGHLNLCKKLIDKHNFDVNIGAKNGATALHYSAISGSYELVKYFVGMGTDIHLKTNDGKNCFHFAAQFGHLNLCKKLIDKHNFDVNIGAKNGATALHYSAISGSYELVKYFVGMGTDIHLKTNDGQNCLHFAAQFGHLNLCKKLIDKHNFDVNIGAKNGATALHYSAISGSYELVKYFVGMGTDIHLKTNDGQNCLHFAAQFGHLNLCKKLIDKHNFDVNIGAKNGATALHYSAISGSYELVKYFVGMGIDIHVKTNNRTNCLHLAARYGHLNLCKLLMNNYNFDVSMANDERKTALHYSAENGSFDLFSYFFGRGCEIYRKTSRMENVLHLSCFGGHLDICRFVLEHFTKDFKDCNIRKHYTLHTKFYRNQVFYKYNAIFLHAMDISGNTYLHLAADGNQAEICELLLKYDTDIIFLRNKEDQTAREIAENNGHKDVLNTLKTEYERAGMSFV